MSHHEPTWHGIAWHLKWASLSSRPGGFGVVLLSSTIWTLTVANIFALFCVPIIVLSFLKADPHFMFTPCGFWWCLGLVMSCHIGIHLSGGVQVDQFSFVPHCPRSHKSRIKRCVEYCLFSFVSSLSSAAWLTALRPVASIQRSQKGKENIGKLWAKNNSKLKHDKHVSNCLQSPW